MAKDVSKMDYDKRGGHPYGRNRELKADIRTGKPFVPRSSKPFRVVNVTTGAEVDTYATRAEAEGVANALNRSSAASHEVRT
jgi:hypothetical protein